MPSDAAICARDVWLSYPRTGTVLKGVSLEVPQGAFWTVFGPSGAGKTSLMKVLAGLIPPERGELQILGHAVNGRIPPWLRQKIGYIPQQLGLVRGLTALENVLLGTLGRSAGPATLLGIFPKQEVRRAEEALVLMGIAHKAKEKAFRLSGGERQRVAIARTLVQEPKLIFADEFISDLDLPRAAQILATMRELGRQQGLTFVINLHEVEVMREVADRALVLKGGVIAHEYSGREMNGEMLKHLLQ
jgi:phosphonate transport system ATP-binding protein